MTDAKRQCEDDAQVQAGPLDERRQPDRVGNLPRVWCRSRFVDEQRGVARRDEELRRALRRSR
ncbi:MAG: hypothetical protein WKF73_07945 [Nocardioidaceae bacterium]